jgi:glycosyltransferase involved in cell wall biosynthesis
MKKISIITPCYNETEEALVDCTSQVSKLFSNELNDYNYEHIICDNNSEQKTISALRKISSKDKNVKIILNAKNYGSIKSLFNGIKNSSGDAVLLFFPVDMQDPPEKIPEFVKKWEEGFDFVVGCRDKREEFFIMKYIRMFFYVLLKIVSKNKIPLNVTEFQLVDRKIVNKFIKLRNNFPFVKTLAFEYSENFDTVKYTWRKRIYGKSKETMAAYINSAMNGLVSVSDTPFRLILILGLIMSMISLLFGFITLIDNLFFEKNLVQGIPLLLISIFVFSGIQLLVLGIIGEYVAAIHNQIKKDVEFNEKERINF